MVRSKVAAAFPWLLFSVARNLLDLGIPSQDKELEYLEEEMMEDVEGVYGVGRHEEKV